MDNIASEGLTGLGLLIALTGAWITARALILKEDDAINIGVSRFSGKDREENLCLAMVQN